MESDSQAGRQPDRQARQAAIQVDSQTGRNPDRQADRQTTQRTNKEQSARTVRGPQRDAPGVQS